MDRPKTNETFRLARTSCAVGFLGKLVRALPCDFSPAAKMARDLQEQRPRYSWGNKLFRSRRRQELDPRARARLPAHVQKDVSVALRFRRRRLRRQRSELCGR